MPIYDEETGKRYNYDEDSGALVERPVEDYDPYSAYEMRKKGYLSDLGPITQSQYTTGAGGRSFADTQAYYDYLYGPGAVTPEVINGETWYKMKDASMGPLSGRTPISYNGPDSALGRMIPMVIGGMALGPLSAALAPTFGALAPAIAGGLVGGTTAEIGGGDFLKGAVTGSLGAGLAGNLSGVSSSLASALPDVPKAVIDAAVSAGSKAVMAGATGGDVEGAIIGSLVNSGVGGVAGENLPADIAKIVTPVVSTAILGGDVETALLKSGLSALKDPSWGVNERTSGGDAEAQEGGFYGIPSAYTGLEGYTPDVIKQLYEGTYAGSEQPEVDVRTQMGDLYDLAYPDAFPTSSSAYEGLGYDANLINQLMEGPSATPNEDGTYTYGGYSGPEQTEAEIRQQMGDELFALAYPDLAAGVTVPATSSGTSGGTTGTTGGTTGTSGGTAGTAGGVNYGALGQKIQNIWNVQEPNYPSPIKPFLSPAFLGGGKYDAPQVPEYSQIIQQLANVLGKRGYKVGGSVHVPGPEGKLYEKHDVQGFAVGGPGTGQSDDIPTMLSDGEYVIDADTVAALGDGSSKAGAEVLDKFREQIRQHKRSAPTDRIPPKAKNPLAYLKSAQKSKG